MALRLRQGSRCCGLLLQAARAAECPGRRSARSSSTAPACRGFAPRVLLPSSSDVLPRRVQAYRHVSAGSRSPAGAEDGPCPSPESNLLSPVKQEEAEAETPPDPSTKALYEGKRP